MITPTNGPEKSPAVYIQKLQKVNGASAIQPAARRDIVSISTFSALVEQARNQVMSMPDIRADVVDKARQSLQAGRRPGAADIASSIINRAARGEV